MPFINLYTNKGNRKKSLICDLHILLFSSGETTLVVREPNCFSSQVCFILHSESMDFYNIVFTVQMKLCLCPQKELDRERDHLPSVD